MSTFAAHWGDCLDVMADWPDGCVDAVIADPPYGSTRNAWDAVVPVEPMWRELGRVCRGAIVLTAIQPFSSILVASRPDWFRHEWVWHKNKASGHLNASRAPLRAHETILVFGRAAVPYFPQMTEGHKPGNFARRRTFADSYGAQRETTYGGRTTRYPRSVLDVPVLNNDSPERVHPTQKPVELMDYLVRTYTEPGQTVLDFCMGSGSTGVAALTCGRKFIGIEKEADIFDIALRRLNARVA